MADRRDIATGSLRRTRVCRQTALFVLRALCTGYRFPTDLIGSKTKINLPKITNEKYIVDIARQHLPMAIDCTEHHSERGEVHTLIK